MIVKAEFV